MPSHVHGEFPTSSRLVKSERDTGMRKGRPEWPRFPPPLEWRPHTGYACTRPGEEEEEAGLEGCVGVGKWGGGNVAFLSTLQTQYTGDNSVTTGSLPLRQGFTLSLVFSGNDLKSSPRIFSYAEVRWFLEKEDITRNHF